MQQNDLAPLKEMYKTVKRLMNEIKQNLLTIILLTILGGTIGFLYAYFKPINYISKTTFVVEESKSATGGLGGLASLAGQFGVDVGGASGTGVLSGDNILVYFRSTTLAREVLLSKLDSANNQTIADKYAEVHGLKEKWQKNKKIGKVEFPLIQNGVKYNRLQDSLLSKLIEKILQTQFSIIKVDKKASFIQVIVKMEDESLSRAYCDKIVETAVKNYITIKTQRQQTTVDKIQARSDSISRLLNLKTVASAGLQTSSNTMDINPIYKTNTAIATEVVVRDKTMLSAIFAEVTKNLELAKFTLSQETPVIQIVDESIFPLEREKTSKAISLIVGSILMFSLSIIFIILRKLYFKIIG